MKETMWNFRVADLRTNPNQWMDQRDREHLQFSHGRRRVRRLSGEPPRRSKSNCRTSDRFSSRPRAPLPAWSAPLSGKKDEQDGLSGQCRRTFGRHLWPPSSTSVSVKPAISSNATNCKTYPIFTPKHAHKHEKKSKKNNTWIIQFKEVWRNDADKREEQKYIPSTPLRTLQPFFHKSKNQL